MCRIKEICFHFFIYIHKSAALFIPRIFFLPLVFFHPRTASSIFSFLSVLWQRLKTSFQRETEFSFGTLICPCLFYATHIYFSLLLSLHQVCFLLTCAKKKIKKEKEKKYLSPLVIREDRIASIAPPRSQTSLPHFLYILVSPLILFIICK